VRLLVAAPKAKAMALLVRQAVELGVEHVVPVQCRFSVAEVRADWAERRGAAECWAAAKQSGNPWLPTVSAPVSFAAALDLTSGESNLFGAVPDHEFSAAESVPDLHRAAMLNVWVGPEGGFAPEERLAFTERGFLAVRIGPYTLRVETAVVALLSWIRGPGRRDP
jgi:16S rRNA (uracil1498-N3)-methyltransferase